MSSRWLWSALAFQWWKQQGSWKNLWSLSALPCTWRPLMCFTYLALKHQLKPDRSLLYFWRNKITFSFVFKLDLFKNKTKTHKTGSLQTRFLKGDVIDAARKSSFIWKRLFYNKTPHFLKVANRTFRWSSGGLCFLFPFSRYCFSQLFSALGPKGLLTFPQQCPSHDCVLLPSKNW